YGSTPRCALYCLSLQACVVLCAFSFFPTRRSSDLGGFHSGDSCSSACRSSGQRQEYSRSCRPWRALRSCASRVNMSANTLVAAQDRKSTRLNSSHDQISYAVFCLKKKKNTRS